MSAIFSVIVPIYKVEKYLRKCINSILNQSFKDFELILVDDGSPDNCPTICDEYASVDSRVRVVHKKNGGLVSARNTGVLAAVGDYICYVDGDDWIAPTLLQVVWEKAIKKHQPDMVVFNAVRQFEDKQVEIPNDAEEGLYNKSRLEQEIYPYMMYDCRKPFCVGLIFPVAWNKIFKRDLLVSHYCKEERIRMGEDNAFVFECLFVSQTVYFCSDVLYYYNQLNSGSITSNYDAGRFDNNKFLTDYIEQKMGGKDKTIDAQINAFKAYWLIMAVFHEVKCGRKLFVSAAHIKAKVKQTKVLSGISLQGLPNTAKVYLILLRMRLYILALLGAKVVSRRRG